MGGGGRAVDRYQSHRGTCCNRWSLACVAARRELLRIVTSWAEDHRIHFSQLGWPFKGSRSDSSGGRGGVRMALNQHAIPCLSLKSSPFYRALRNMAGTGRVVMVLDKDASALTRIWCVYEVWVSRSLRLTFQMFVPSGELNFLRGDKECRTARDRIVSLNLAKVECSVEEDKNMILGVIDESDGGREAVS